MVFPRNCCQHGGIFILALLLFSFVLAACNDVGLDEDFFTSVQGNLVIEGIPPKETDELLLALVDGLSPKFTRTIPRRALSPEDSMQTQTVPFTLEAQSRKIPGEREFDALFVVWKERGEQFNIIENIVGSNCTDGSLLKIRLSPENPIVSGVSIDVNLKKVDRKVDVSGAIHFRGAWPQNLENLALVFADAANLSGSLDVCELLKSMDIRLLDTTPVDSLRFETRIARGPKVVLVAWNEAGGSLFTPKFVLGNFIDSGADSVITGIEITADFDRPAN